MPEHARWLGASRRLTHARGRRRVRVVQGLALVSCIEAMGRFVDPKGGGGGLRNRSDLDRLSRGVLSVPDGGEGAGCWYMNHVYLDHPTRSWMQCRVVQPGHPDARVLEKTLPGPIMEVEWETTPKARMTNRVTKRVVFTPLP